MKSQAVQYRPSRVRQWGSGVSILLSVLLLFAVDLALLVHLFPAAWDAASTWRLLAGEIGLAALVFVLLFPVQALAFSLYRLQLRLLKNPCLAMLSLCLPLAGLGFPLGENLFSGPVARNMAIAPFAPYLSALLLPSGFWVLLVLSRRLLAGSRAVTVLTGLVAMAAALGLLVADRLILPGLYNPLHWSQQILALVLLQISVTALLPAGGRCKLRSGLAVWALALPVALLILYPATRRQVAPALSQFVCWGGVSRYIAGQLPAVWPDPVASDFFAYLAGLSEDEQFPETCTPTPPDQLSQFKSKLPPGKMNFMLVVLDALRADQIAAFGLREREPSLTPNIDEFAEKSFRFINTTSQASCTGNSIPSLFSSQRTFTGSEMRFPTFISLFNAAGYNSFASLPQYFQLIAHEHLMFMNEGFGRVEYTDKKKRVDFEATIADLLKQETADPFFAYMHFYQLHADYYTPPLYTNDYPGFDGLPPYDKATLYSDEVFGRMMKQMREQGLLENTIIAVTADHGEAFMEHGQKFHSTSCHWEQVRVPMMLYIPGFHGGESKAHVGNVDILPTIAELFDLPNRLHFLGRSLVSLMMGEDDHEDRIYFTRSIGNRVRAVMDARYKLIYANHTLQLFDLKNDPGELRDIYHPESLVARRLMLELYLTFPDVWRKMLGNLNEHSMNRCLSLLKTAKSPRARQAAAVLLYLHPRKLRNRHTRGFISLYNREKSPQVRISLSRLLGKSSGKRGGDALVSRFQLSQGLERYETAFALSLRNAAQHDSLFLQLLNDENEDMSLRHLAMNAIRNKSEKHIQAAYLALTESDQPSDMRIAAIKALHGIADGKIEKHLLRLLDDADYKVRFTAAESLGYFPSSAEAMLQRYRTESHLLVRRGLLVAIARTQTPQAFSLCEAALADRMMVAPAIYGFALLKDQRALPLLKKVASTYDNRWTRELAEKMANELKAAKEPASTDK